MKLQSYKNIIKTDFPAEYQSLVEQLGQTINSSFQQLYAAMNNQITIPDNLNATLVTLPITVDTSGSPTAKTSFNLKTYQTTVNGFIVLNAIGSTNTIVPTGPVQILTWTKTNSTITITNISGLAANKAYTLTILVL
jgi:hypothetical protein